MILGFLGFFFKSMTQDLWVGGSDRGQEAIEERKGDIGEVMRTVRKRIAAVLEKKTGLGITLYRDCFTFLRDNFPVITLNYHVISRSASGHE